MRKLFDSLVITILFWCALVSLFGCSPAKRLARIERKHPELFATKEKIDTLWQTTSDTFYTTVDSSAIKATVKCKDGIPVIQIIESKDSKTAHSSLIVKNGQLLSKCKCDSQAIIATVKYPVIQKTLTKTVTVDRGIWKGWKTIAITYLILTAIGIIFLAGGILLMGILPKFK